MRASWGYHDKGVSWVVHTIEVNSLTPLNVKNPKLRQGCFHLRAVGKVLFKAFLSLASGHFRILRLADSLSHVFTLSQLHRHSQGPDSLLLKDVSQTG